MNTTKINPAIEPLTCNAPMQQHEYMFLFSLIILSLIVHWPFLFDGFGEPDAARIATVAVLNYHSPENYKIGQVTPLYQLLLVGALSAGMNKVHVPALMNYGNLVLGSLCLIPLYLLWRRNSCPQTAAVACVLYFFTPAFWFANLYGMPHLPAFFFLLWAAIAFQKAIQYVCPVSFLGYSSLATGLMLLTLLFKVDAVLYAGLFVGLVVVFQAGSIRNYVASVIVPLLALAFSFAFVKTFSMTRPLTAGYAARWHADWPTDITAMKDTIPVWSVGAVFFVGILISGAYCLFQSSLRRYVFLAMMWAAPAMLFWCLRWGNSIRHMMIAFSVLIFLLALTLVHCCAHRRKIFVGIIMTGVVLNYFLMPVERQGINRGGHLIKTPLAVQAYHNTIIQNGKDLFNAPYDEMIVFGGESIPYVLWELFVRYDLTDKPQSVQMSYTVFDKPSRSWQCCTTDAVKMILEGPSRKRRMIQYVYVPLNTTLLNDSLIPYWSCQESVDIVARPEDVVGHDKDQ